MFEFFVFVWGTGACANMAYFYTWAAKSYWYKRNSDLALINVCLVIALGVGSWLAFWAMRSNLKRESVLRQSRLP